MKEKTMILCLRSARESILGHGSVEDQIQRLIGLDHAVAALNLNSALRTFQYDCATLRGHIERDIEGLNTQATAIHHRVPAFQRWTENAPSNCEWCGRPASAHDPIEKGEGYGYIHPRCRDTAIECERRRIEDERRAIEAVEERDIALRMAGQW